MHCQLPVSKVGLLSGPLVRSSCASFLMYLNPLHLAIIMH